jgi:hypothetical protein
LEAAEDAAPRLASERAGHRRVDRRELAVVVVHGIELKRPAEQDAVGPDDRGDRRQGRVAIE